MEQNRKPVALTVEQMKMLKDLGYDTSKASMAYYTYGSGKTVLREASDDAQVAKKCVPAFTLEDVLAILPSVKLPFGLLLVNIILLDLSRIWNLARQQAVVGWMLP